MQSKLILTMFIFIISFSYRSVKHYFLLDQGDFIVQFMDMAEEELQKDIDYIMPTRLESLLELALRTSVVNEDKYKDDVRLVLYIRIIYFKNLVISMAKYGRKKL